MKILIADDHELFLQGLKFILQNEYSQAEIVAAHNYTEIFSVLDKCQDFDLIITDLAMPGANWLQSIEKMHKQCSEVPIIVISAVFEPEILRKTYDIGVAGYISKSFPNSVIIGAINLVLAGGMYISPELLQANLRGKDASPIKSLLENLNETKKNEANVSNPLTPRQTEVLYCLEQGMSNKQIARKLGLSEGTVKIHITLLMRALNVSNRVQAVHEGTRRGLLKTGEKQ